MKINSKLLVTVFIHLYFDCITQINNVDSTSCGHESCDNHIINYCKQNARSLIALQLGNKEMFRREFKLIL